MQARLYRPTGYAMVYTDASMVIHAMPNTDVSMLIQEARLQYTYRRLCIQ